MEAFAFVLLCIWAWVTAGDRYPGVGVSSGYGGAFGGYGERRGYSGRAAAAAVFPSPAYIYSPSVAAQYGAVGREKAEVSRKAAAPDAAVSTAGYTGYGSGGRPGEWARADRSRHPSYHGDAPPVWTYASGWW